MDFVVIELFFYFPNQKLFIYVRFYLLYHLPNFMYFEHKHVEIENQSNLLIIPQVSQNPKVVR